MPVVITAVATEAAEFIEVYPLVGVLIFVTFAFWAIEIFRK